MRAFLLFRALQHMIHRNRECNVNIRFNEPSAVFLPYKYSYLNFLSRCILIHHLFIFRAASPKPCPLICSLKPCLRSGFHRVSYRISMVPIRCKKFPTFLIEERKTISRLQLRVAYRWNVLSSFLPLPSLLPPSPLHDVIN